MGNFVTIELASISSSTWQLSFHHHHRVGTAAITPGQACNVNPHDSLSMKRNYDFM